jgi:hypothetical protein
MVTTGHVDYKPSTWYPFRSITEGFKLITSVPPLIGGCLVAKLNNEYHLFLYSCMEADGDISSVAWEYMENLPNNIKNTNINRRALPNFIVSTMIPVIADQSRKEFKQKQESEKKYEITILRPISSSHMDGRPRRCYRLVAA